MANIAEMIDTVYNELQAQFKNETIHCQGKNGVNTLVLFDEPELIPGKKSRFKVGNLTILIVRNEKPFLSVEIIPTSPTPPKTIAGLIPIHMITRSIVINRKEGDNLKYDLDLLDNKISLLIVVPDQSETVKEAQFVDLDEKFRGVINLRSEYSNYKDFAITPIRNLKTFINDLLNKEYMN